MSIYADQDQGLSWIAKLSFKSPPNNKDKKIIGYEIVFEKSDIGIRSCVQILSLDHFTEVFLQVFKKTLKQKISIFNYFIKESRIQFEYKRSIIYVLDTKNANAF